MGEKCTDVNLRDMVAYGKDRTRIKRGSHMSHLFYMRSTRSALKQFPGHVATPDAAGPAAVAPLSLSPLRVCHQGKPRLTGALENLMWASPCTLQARR